MSIRNKVRIYHFSAIFFLFLAGFFLSGCTKKSHAVTFIVINPGRPSIVYITTNDAIYKTRNDGASWVSVTQGLGNARILSLAIHPEYNSTIYAGTLGDAVYRSMDGANRWSIINAGLKEHVMYVNGFIFHPESPDTVFAVTTVGIFKTTDAGQMWDELSNRGMDSVYVVAAAIDPNDGDILYAGTSGGIYKTNNGGIRWREANTGMIRLGPSTALSLGVNSLVMDPANPKVLYAGTTRGLFRTLDGAESWERLQGDMGNRYISVIVIHPTETATLIVGAQDGIYKTLDAGDSWASTNSGLTNLNIRSLVIHPQNPDILYAGTQGGLFKTLNGGEAWSALNFAGEDEAKK